jgi:hypothetical protein
MSESLNRLPSGPTLSASGTGAEVEGGESSQRYEPSDLHGSTQPAASATPSAPFSEVGSALCADRTSQRDVPTISITSDPDYYRAASIAQVLGCSKKTVLNRARAEAWPSRCEGNHYEFAPPAELAAVLAEHVIKAPTLRSVSFSDLTHSEAQRARTLLKEAAVQYYLGLVRKGELCDRAAGRTCAAFVDRLAISRRSLARWVPSYQKHGLNGLVEQKRGVVGGKAMHVPEEFARRGKALVIEHGSVARAARVLASHPDLPAEMREHLHDAFSSKSTVNPSLRAAIRPSELTVALAQGPRQARLSGRFTPGDYSNVKAGDVFTSDDMTSNIVCWCEWPNQQGWRIGQPQILPVMDVGSLRWLNVRVIMREGGQYSSDDIWGLFGDVFDTFGLPHDGFLLEGGHWQANKIKGERTGLSEEERIGGLQSLGLKMRRSYDPRSKGMLEGAFNQLQFALDAFPGYVGRDQRTQLPEAVKKQLALCKAGKAHPSQFFTKIDNLADHVRRTMENFNHERQDGQILRGRSPLEKWAEDGPRLPEIPDKAKWLYRSAMSVSKVTRNGVRVTLGSGAKLLPYYYDNPALMVALQGRKVVIYWNHYAPETDAVILDGETRKFLGVAQYVTPVDRFAGTDAQLESEARRKSAALHYARTELRSIQPEMQRARTLVPVDQRATELGREIHAAAARTEKAEAVERNTRAKMRSVEVTDADIASALQSDRTREETTSADEISALFADVNGDNAEGQGQSGTDFLPGGDDSRTLSVVATAGHADYGRADVRPRQEENFDDHEHNRTRSRAEEPASEF